MKNFRQFLKDQTFNEAAPGGDLGAGGLSSPAGLPPGGSPGGGLGGPPPIGGGLGGPPMGGLGGGPPMGGGTPPPGKSVIKLKTPDVWEIINNIIDEK